MKRIQAPDGGILEFPDDMSDDAILGVMRKEFGGPAAAGGDAPWYKKAGQAADDIVRLTANGLTFGYADKLAGWAGGEGTAAERAKSQEAKDRAGWAGTAAEVAGSLATGLGAAGAGLTTARVVPQGMRGLTGLGARTVAAGVEGAGYGALGAMGNDQDVAKGAAFGAGAGALGNVAGEAIAGTVGKVAGAFNRQPKVPTIDELRAGKDAAYKASDEAGVILKPDVVQGLRGKVQEDLANFGYLPANQPKIKAILDELDRVAEGNITLKGLDQIRKQAGGAFDPTNKASNAIATKIIQRIDEAAGKVSPESVLAGDAAQGVGKLKEARDLNTRVSKYDRITEALARGERNAQSSGSGGNVDNATRQQIKTIRNSPSKSRGFSDDELAAMDQIIRGTPLQEAVRSTSKLSPTGNGLMTALGIGGAAANPALAAVPAVGAVAKVLSDRQTRGSVDELLRIIQGGGKRSDAFAPPNAIERLAESKRDALIRALMMGGITLSPRAAEQP